MKRDEIDWTILKWSVINIVACLFISSLIAAGSYYFMGKIQAQSQQSRRMFQSISQRYLAVDEEERLIKQFYHEFVDYYNKGIIGREHRLNWIEILRQSSEQTQLPSLNYEITSRGEFTPEYAINPGRYRLFSSSMRLDLGLLHEVDLLQLFRDLDEQAEGAYSVSECTFDRKNPEITESRDTANITVKCLLNWFTIELASGEKLDLP